MTKIYTRGKTPEGRWGRWMLWATFAVQIDAEAFAATIRKTHPTWQVVVGNKHAPRQHEWNVELSEDGQLEVVRTRTGKQESEHERRMEKWARQNYERD